MLEVGTGRLRRPRRRVTVWSAVVVIAVLLFCAVWITVRASIARSELAASVGLVHGLQAQLAAGDTDAALKTAARLRARVHAAHDATSDPIWRAAEAVPWLGPNLSAVGTVASVISDVTDDAIVPLARVARSPGLSGFEPVDGVIPLEPIVAVRPTAAAADSVMRSALSRVRKIDVSGVVRPVAAAVVRLRTELETTAGEVASVHRAVRLLPDMLGSDGPRNYLLLMQNNAEARSTGGITGAIALLHVENGRITLTKQASTQDFPGWSSPVAALPDDTRRLYGSLPAEHIQDVNLTPRFPLTARLAREMWHKRFGTDVDGVISIDPVALSHLLPAIGPVEVAGGETLTAGNVVKTLLSDTYARFQDPKRQDAFFAAAAEAVFTKAMSGNVDPTKLLEGLVRSGKEHRLLIWSAHPGEQSSLAQTELAGIPHSNSAGAGAFGVYLNDSTGAKMDYYLRTAVGLGSAVCRSDGRANLLVTVTLSNVAPKDAGRALPAYVTGGGRYGVPPGDMRTGVAVYAPPGTVLLGVARGGEAAPVRRAHDAGSTVAQTSVRLKPGATTTLAFQFLEAPSAGGGHHEAPEMSARTTPGVVAGEVKKASFGCSDVLG